MIKNGKIVIEVEKDKENVSVRVEDLSLWDICNLMGAALNYIIIDSANRKTDEIFFKVCAMRDICSQIGLTATAERLDEILGENLNDD